MALAGDHLGKIDKATGNVDIVEPHKKGAGPRRVWSDSKGVLWVSFWHSGEVGRYDPAAKAWKTWLLPGNPGSGCYSVYVDEQDKVWLTDFLTNSIVRFDPADRDSSKPSRAASGARRCARCSAGPAKPGAPNPATTGWCKLSIDAPRAPGPAGLVLIWRRWIARPHDGTFLRLMAGSPLLAAGSRTAFAAKTAADRAL